MQLDGARWTSIRREKNTRGRAKSWMLGKVMSPATTREYRLEPFDGTTIPPPQLHGYSKIEKHSVLKAIIDELIQKEWL